MRAPFRVVLSCLAGVAVFFAGIYVSIHLASLHADDVSAIANVLLLLVTVAGVAVAIAAVETWRAQVRGAGRLQVAIEVADAIGNLKIELQNQRAGNLESEWPKDFDTSAPREGSAYREGLEFVYTNRLNTLNKYVFAVHSLRGKAITVLNRECADAIAELAREARVMESVWRLYCEMSAWDLDSRGDDARAAFELVREKAVVPLNEEPTDPVTIAFNRKFEHALSCLKPFLEVLH